MSNYDRRDRQDETAMWDAGEVRRQESAQQQRRGDEKRRSARATFPRAAASTFPVSFVVLIERATVFWFTSTS